MVAILQPFIPHYREEFFNGLNEKIALDIYCYEDQERIQTENYKQARIIQKKIPQIKIGPFVVFNPRPLLRKEYDILVLMLNFTHITSWLLLLTKVFHRKKIIVWGHGISARRFTKEVRSPNILLKWMIALADEVWFYTGYEQQLWKRIFPAKPTVSLNNTISGIQPGRQFYPSGKTSLREKYGITQEIILIFCARFNAPERRTDLLETAIRQADKNQYGFIIIGDGKLKPDLSSYKNVYDFGEVYDKTIKDELFQIADIYFQPAWLGLSVVEAMAYQKPVFTLERNAAILHGPEYNYLIDRYNSAIAKDIDQFHELLNGTTREDLDRMSTNCKLFTESHLTMENMINRAYQGIQQI